MSPPSLDLLNYSGRSRIRSELRIIVTTARTLPARPRPRLENPECPVPQRRVPLTWPAVPDWDSRGQPDHPPSQPYADEHSPEVSDPTEVVPSPPVPRDLAWHAGVGIARSASKRRIGRQPNNTNQIYPENAGRPRDSQDCPEADRGTPVSTAEHACFRHGGPWSASSRYLPRRRSSTGRRPSAGARHVP